MALPPALLPLLLVASLSAAAAASSGSDMPTINVLLPSGMANPVQYRLFGTLGCYVWSWDDHKILWGHLKFNQSGGCSTSASLVSTSPLIDQNEVIIDARNLQLGTSEAIIVTIEKIKIFDHANKTDIGHLPKQVHLEENVASSDSYVINGIGIDHQNVGVQVKSPTSHKDEISSYYAIGRTAEIDASYTLFIVVLLVSLLVIFFIMYPHDRHRRKGDVKPPQILHSESSLQPSEVPTPPSFQSSRPTPLPYMKYLKSKIHETPRKYGMRRYNRNRY